ncbi:MAG: glycoside hydrolase family 16 protein [Planctomycetota bacterium]|nr:glycoside hydrolase family 16 protein [Planctomycetota bacterium]
MTMNPFKFASLRRWMALPLLLCAACTQAGEGEAPPAPQPADTLPEAKAGQAWKLVWNDEFDGEKLDEAKWELPEYKRHDAQWSKRAAALDGQGRLVMKTFKEGETYFNGCVRTKGRFEHAFGYFTARMKLQKKAGHWTAFWMFNQSVGKVGNDGRDGSEIDIMEKPKLDEKVHHAIHWDGYGKDHKAKGQSVAVPGVLEGWHDFAVLWLPDEYVFYVDGKETWRTKEGGVCQVPLYLKFSDEIQFKGWAGDIRKEELPDEFQVDHVRVYDLIDAQTGKPVYPVPETSIPKPQP